MKYALLIHLSPENAPRQRDPAAAAAGQAYGAALNAAGVFVGGAGLGAPQSATSVSVRDGKRQVQDGPFADSKEYLGGFVVIDVPDLDSALEWAARHPAAAENRVEVRPLAGYFFGGGGANGPKGSG